MALDYGNELGGIILIGTGARLRVLPSILADAKNSPSEARTTLSKFALSPANEVTMTQSVLKEQDTLSANILYRDLAACNIFDIMSRLYEISLPTLIICGAEDRLTPVKYSEYLHQRIPHSTLQIIPDAGHYVMREQPEQVNQAIEAWMRQALSPSTH
jgi:pimeloyl-ACP methyl ester carboxylesterase